jgi:three-Cys-motif partner protein
MAKKNAQGQQELFGGGWTQEKLQRVQKYLSAYCQIFKPSSKGGYFSTTYVDAFAGTGYMQTRDMPLAGLFPQEYEELSQQAEEYSKGSAVRALETEPGFGRYIFIELDEQRAAELQKVAARFPTRHIEIVIEDANKAIQRWCAATNWCTNRAVVFLDPFGMQVEWRTIETIAQTRGIDMWLLFPIFGVNRMLVRHGKPPESWRAKLNSVFGTAQWEDSFYATTESRLIEGVRSVSKTANIDKVTKFFVNRLRGIFAAVADPLVLRNNRDAALFLLLFAAANEKGAPTAIKIARHILAS